MTAELYKIEVPDYGNEEINRMAVAYEAFRELPLDAQARCVRWLSDRLRADRLNAKVGAMTKIQRLKP